MRYLGVILGGELSFGVHISHAADKATAEAGKLYGHMATIGGSSPPSTLLIRAAEGIPRSRGVGRWTEVLKVQ